MVLTFAEIARRAETGTLIKGDDFFFKFISFQSGRDAFGKHIDDTLLTLKTVFIFHTSPLF